MLQLARRWLYDHKHIIPRERELRGYIAEASRQHEATLVGEIIEAIDPDLLAQFEGLCSADGPYLIGGPSTVAGKLWKLSDDLGGVSRVNLQMSSAADDPPTMLRAIELPGTEVGSLVC